MYRHSGKKMMLETKIGQGRLKHRRVRDVGSQWGQGCCLSEKTGTLVQRRIWEHNRDRNADRNVPTQRRQGCWKHTGVRDVGSQWGQGCCLLEKTGVLVHSGVKHSVSQRRQGCWFTVGPSILSLRKDRGVGSKKDLGTERRQECWDTEGDWTIKTSRTP